MAESREVKAIFKDSIKDLDEDIFKIVEEGSFAAKAIERLRGPITKIEDLLATLGSRHTLWLKDQANIAGLLAGIRIRPHSERGDIYQRGIYQKILRNTGKISHGHLFHKSATMSEGFSWCATSLLQLPQARADPAHPPLSINEDGEVVRKWKVVRIADDMDKSYVYI